MMLVKFSVSAAQNEIHVKIDEGGKLVKEMHIPFTSEFENNELEFMVEFEDLRYYVIADIELPKGYFAIGMFVGRKLTGIFLTGKGLSLVVGDKSAVYRAVTTNETRLEQEQCEANEPKAPGM